MIRTRRVEDVDYNRFRLMDKRCFSGESRYDFPESDTIFITYDDSYPWSVYTGYICISIQGKITRCGVVPKYRGRGIQRKLIRAAIRWVKRTTDPKFMYLTAYTQNRPVGALSALNFISCGFRLTRRTKQWLYLRWDSK